MPVLKVNYRTILGEYNVYETEVSEGDTVNVTCSKPENVSNMHLTLKLPLQERVNGTKQISGKFVATRNMTRRSIDCVMEWGEQTTTSRTILVVHRE